MDESVLRNLLSALETINNAGTTNDARQQAQEYCESLKRDPAGPLYGYYLAHKDNQQPDIVRHFGLSLIENTARYKWSAASLTPELKTQIRLNVMSLASEGILPMMTEKSFIKEKAASLFVEVAKREWPGTWDDMDVFLRQMFFKDETAREMSLVILRSLCEDVCIYDDAVAGLRKKDLRAGLLVIMSSEAVLHEHYPDGVKGHKNEVTLMVGEQGNDGWLSRLAMLLQELLPRCQLETKTLADEKTAVAALRTLSATLDWVISSSVSTTSVIPLICQAILSPSEKIRLAGAECYDVLSSRNLSEPEREKMIWPLLDDGGIDLISKAYLTYSNQPLQGDSYLFFQKMVQATVNLGEQQLCAKRNARVPKELLKFLQLLFAMTSHPSVILSSFVSFFWTTLLRHDTFSKDPTVHAFIPPLLELYSGVLAKDFEHRRESDPIYAHFVAQDFESPSDFRAKVGNIFQKAVDVIHLGVPIVPLPAFLWVANKVSEALKIEFPISTNVKNTIQFQALDGALTLMEVSISSLTDIINDKTNPQSGEILEAMNTLLGLLIEYNGKCPAALERIAASLSSYTDMFKLKSTHLFRCLDKLFKLVEYPMASKGDLDIRELRHRSGITLVKIGKAIPNTLYPIYGEIDTAIQRLIQQGAISGGEKKTLLSFQLVIGFNAGMALERGAIFEKVVGPVALGFQSVVIQEALSDPTKFMVFIGAMELSEASNRNLQGQEVEQLGTTIARRRSLLSWSVDALLTFMRETMDSRENTMKELWAAYLGPMLPNLLSTIRCLNALCDEQAWAGLSPEMGRVLVLSSEEKEIMVTGKTLSVTSGAPALTVTKLISDLKTWLSVLRDHCYKFLAHLSTIGIPFYSIPSLQTVLEQTLFEHVDNLTNRQLRLLINSAVQPIVINCPAEYMESTISHLLTVLFPYLDQRLERDWKAASADGLVVDEQGDPEDMDVSDEIVKEMMLRDLTSYVANFLFAILDFGRQKGSSTAATHKELTPLALHVLSSDTIAKSVILLLCRIITYKDTKSCTRAAETALCALSALVQCYPQTQAIIGDFATMVLQAALEALHDPYHQEGQEKLILLITEVYVEVRAFNEAPRAVFQQVSGAESSRLEAFEQELSTTTNKTKKHALVRNFLQGIIGVAKSEWFKKKEQGDKPAPIRTIAGSYERPSQNVMDSEHHEDIGEGLASLFDE
ncbi:MAG: armadillo-type protein [Linnemannia gamsii]|nr:MAG: armadillo-type protein [Linnemannia gamsii]